MKFEDALKLMREGKYVRKPTWDTNEKFNIFEDNKKPSDDTSKMYALWCEEIIDNSWEEFQEGE